MARDRSLVRASDIGFWTFCNRAWWLARVQEAEHGAPQVLARGEETHEAHGRALLHAERLHRLGVVLCALALILAGIGLLFWLSG